MYCESQPRFPGKTWMDLFPDDIFPNETPDDRQKSWSISDSGYQFHRFFFYSAIYARDLLSKMLQIDPKNRITVDEALQHPYVKIWFDEGEVFAVCAVFTGFVSMCSLSLSSSLIFSHLLPPFLPPSTPLSLSPSLPSSLPLFLPLPSPLHLDMNQVLMMKEKYH